LPPVKGCGAATPTASRHTAGATKPIRPQQRCRRHRRIAEAHFPRLKRLEDFRFDEAPRIPAAAIRELATLGFVDRAEPVIFVGESGTGKSHLAIALGIAACMQHRRVRFVTTAGLVNELREARDDRSLSRLVARYARIEVLVLD